MTPEQAIKHITDRHELAGKMLDAEMTERPVVYGRQPSWHKFNVVGGWPKRIPGNMIRVNALVTTGLSQFFMRSSRWTSTRRRLRPRILSTAS